MNPFSISGTRIIHLNALYILLMCKHNLIVLAHRLHFVQLRPFNQQTYITNPRFEAVCAYVFGNVTLLVGSWLGQARVRQHLPYLSRTLFVPDAKKRNILINYLLLVLSFLSIMNIGLLFLGLLSVLLIGLRHIYWRK